MAAAAALAELDTLLQPNIQFQDFERLDDLVAELRRGSVDEVVEFLKVAAARVSSAQCGVPAPLPAGRAPTDADLQLLQLALSATRCCGHFAGNVLSCLNLEAAQLLGSGAAYRLLAACSWAFGDEALAILRLGLRAAQAHPAAAGPNKLWEALLGASENVLFAASWVVKTLAQQEGSTVRPLPFAKAALGTVCTREKLLALLDAAAEVVVAADEATGAAMGRNRLWKGLDLVYHRTHCCYPALPAAAPAYQALASVAAGQLAALCAGRPAEVADEEVAVQWMERWVAAGSALCWGACCGSLPAPGRVQLLAQLNGVAAWLLQQHGHGVVWRNREPLNECPVKITARAACSVACGLLGPHRPSPQELVLAAEAAGLAASAQLPVLDRRPAAPGGVLTASDLSLVYIVEVLEQLFEGLATQDFTSPGLPPPGVCACPGIVAAGRCGGHLSRLGRAGGAAAAGGRSRGTCSAARAGVGKEGVRLGVSGCRQPGLLFGSADAAGPAAGGRRQGGCGALRQAGLARAASCQEVEGAEEERHASIVLWAKMDAARALLRLKPAVARLNTPPDAVNAACYFTSVFPWFCSAHAPLRLFELSGAYDLAASFALEAVRCFPAGEGIILVALVPFQDVANSCDAFPQLLASHPRALVAFVRSGLVRELLGWAEQAARAFKALVGLEAVRELLLQVLRTAKEAAAPADDSAFARTIRQLEGLSKKQLRNRAAWEQLRRGTEAPLAACAERMAAAAATMAAEPGNQRDTQLQVVRLLAVRVCANPACTAVRGASEARARGRRCSGCRVARYCSPECQAAAWPEHGRVCAALRGAVE